MIVRDISRHVEQNFCGIWFFGGFRGFCKDPWNVVLGILSTYFSSPFLISLRASSPGNLAEGREIKEELATTSLELILNSTSNSPVVPRRLSCQLSHNQHEAETSANVNKNWKHVPRVMTSLLMSSPPISISHRLFRCRHSNSRDVVASSPSFCQRAPEILLEGHFLMTPSSPITT